MKAEAFVIHLARATARRPQAEKLLRELPLPAGIIDAVDGLALTESEMGAVYSRHLHLPRYPFSLRKQEIGCFLSHRKAWREIVDRGLDGGLIVEDDVEVEAGFREVFGLAAANLDSRDYIRFPRWSRGEGGTAILREGDLAIIAPKLPGLGMQMQLVGRGAAEILLRATEIFDRPVDTTIQMRWLHEARILSARPIAIREIHRQLGGTVIQKKAKPISEVLMREVKRPLYRLAVRMRNTREGSRA